MSEVKAGIGGEHYQPYAERTGGESVVFFTRDLSAEGLKKAYAAIQGNLTGKVAVKLHTGEQNGPNIIPRPWVKSLMEQIPNSTIVETNTYYEGDRYTTAQHRETLKIKRLDVLPGGYYGRGRRGSPAGKGRQVVYRNARWLPPAEL